MERFANRVVIVTGAGSGIGQAIAHAFAREGATVIVAGRRFAPLQQTVKGIRAAGGNAFALTVDVTQADRVESLMHRTVARCGRIDVLINNAGVGSVHPFLEFPYSVWEETLAINLTGTFLCAQFAAKQMVEQRRGRIVNITSISGIRAGTGRAAYGASKAGVISLTRQMALELAPHGITVNAVAPGPVDTPLTRGMHSPETRRNYEALIPLGRYGSCEEIAAGALFLASPEASYINGHVLAIEGGYLAAGVQGSATAAQDPVSSTAPTSGIPDTRFCTSSD